MKTCDPTLVMHSGYLLEPNGEKCVTVPRQVSALHHKEATIAMAAASNGATVCVTEKGDVYLLADYQCKKLASKWVELGDKGLSLCCLSGPDFVQSNQKTFLNHLYHLKYCFLVSHQNDFA